MVGIESAGDAEQRRGAPRGGRVQQQDKGPMSRDEVRRAGLREQSMTPAERQRMVEQDRRRKAT